MLLTAQTLVRDTGIQLGVGQRKSLGSLLPVGTVTPEHQPAAAADPTNPEIAVAAIAAVAD